MYSRFGGAQGKFQPNRLHLDSLWDWDGRKREKAKYGTSRDLELHRRLEKLTLVCRSMWTLCQERFKITEEELIQRTMEIDLLDGKADGRVSVPAQDCKACGRKIASHHARCVYCGGTKLVKSVFETV
jgi:hypothetical protein